MKVILIQDVKAQGKKGDVIEVSDGYAINFLLKRKLAIEANSKNLSELKSQNEARQFKIETERKAAMELGDKLKNITVKIQAKSGEGDKLFGAVTSKEIADILQKEHNIEIDKRKIILKNPIKAFGEYTAEVKLYEKISADLKVLVIK